MPSIEFEHNGNYCRIDSSDPIVIGRWLVERIMAVSPGQHSDITRLRILPMFGRDGKPDWSELPAANGYIDRESLNRLRQYIMAWQAERERDMSIGDSNGNGGET